MEFHPDRNPSNSSEIYNFIFLITLKFKTYCAFHGAEEAANNFKKALEAYQALSVKNDVKNR